MNEAQNLSQEEIDKLEKNFLDLRKEHSKWADNNPVIQGFTRDEWLSGKYRETPEGKEYDRRKAEVEKAANAYKPYMDKKKYPFGIRTGF